MSFDTISSIGKNGAIIHYKPEEGTCSTLTTTELYLNDSGGQYLDGTTDVTRTLHFGKPSSYEKECFTHVLKGHIALATCIFPNKCEGIKLDTVTRMALWRYLSNFFFLKFYKFYKYLNVLELVWIMYMGQGMVSELFSMFMKKES